VLLILLVKKKFLVDPKTFQENLWCIH